jgi:hypothetical protein
VKFRLAVRQGEIKLVDLRGTFPVSDADVVNSGTGGAAANTSLLPLSHVLVGIFVTSGDFIRMDDDHGDDGFFLRD